MKVIELPLAQLVDATWNPNQMSLAMLNRLQVSIRRYGLVENLVVREISGGLKERSHDPLFPLADARRAASVLHDAELIVVQGSGHWPYLEAPETFNPALLGFLAQSEEALVR